MLGYWQRPEETAAAFRGEWFVTGDRARMGEDGVDRLSRPGRRPDERRRLPGQPAEVEAALLAHPGVAEAAAVDVPCASGATVIAAFYVPRGGAVDEADLAAHCAGAARALQVPADFPRRRGAAPHRRRQDRPPPAPRRLSRNARETGTRSRRDACASSLANEQCAIFVLMFNWLTMCARDRLAARFCSEPCAMASPRPFFGDPSDRIWSSPAKALSCREAGGRR